MYLYWKANLVSTWYSVEYLQIKCLGIVNCYSWVCIYMHSRMLNDYIISLHNEKTPPTKGEDSVSLGTILDTLLLVTGWTHHFQVQTYEQQAVDFDLDNHIPASLKHFKNCQIHHRAFKTIYLLICSNSCLNALKDLMSTMDIVQCYHLLWWVGGCAPH